MYNLKCVLKTGIKTTKYAPKKLKNSVILMNFSIFVTNTVHEHRRTHGAAEAANAAPGLSLKLLRPVNIEYWALLKLYFHKRHTNKITK